MAAILSPARLLLPAAFFSYWPLSPRGYSTTVYPGDTTVYPAFKLKAEKPSFVYRLSVRLTLSLSSAYTVSVLSVNMSVSESVSLSVNLTVVCLSVCLSVNMSVSEYVCL